MESLQTVELTPTKIADLNEQPKIETCMWVSKDKKWFIYKTVITDIKPISYMDRVFDNTEDL